MLWVGWFDFNAGSGTGDDFMRQIAVRMVGGMISATILTLAVIPAVFLLWQKWKLNGKPSGTGR